MLEADSLWPKGFLRCSLLPEALEGFGSFSLTFATSNKLKSSKSAVCFIHFILCDETVFVGPWFFHVPHQDICCRFAGCPCQLRPRNKVVANQRLEVRPNFLGLSLRAGPALLEPAAGPARGEGIPTGGFFWLMLLPIRVLG